MAALTSITRLQNLHQAISYKLPSTGAINTFFTGTGEGTFAEFTSSNGDKYALAGMDAIIGGLDVSAQSKSVLQALSQFHSAVEAELAIAQIGGMNYVPNTITEAIGGVSLSYKFDRDGAAQTPTASILKDRLESVLVDSKSYSTTLDLSTAVLNAINYASYPNSAVSYLSWSFTAGITASVYADIDAVQSALDSAVESATGSGTSLISNLASAMEGVTIGATLAELTAGFTGTGTGGDTSKASLIDAVDDSGYTASSLATAIYNTLDHDSSEFTAAEIRQDIERLIAGTGSAFSAYTDADSVAGALNTAIDGTGVADTPAGLAAAVASVTIAFSTSFPSAKFSTGLTGGIAQAPVSITSAIGHYDISVVGDTVTEAILNLKQDAGTADISGVGSDVHAAILALDEKARLDSAGELSSADSIKVCYGTGTGTGITWESTTNYSGSLTDLSSMVNTMLDCFQVAYRRYEDGKTLGTGSAAGTTCTNEIDDPAEALVRCVEGLFT
ncbi:MAG: hypothetical protein RLN62_03085 [Rickettsiales bacterium]